VTIQVGLEPNDAKFVAHESFLTARSEFFRRAINGSWKESDTRVVKLPEDDPEIFALYINYIYTGQLVTAQKSNEEFATLDFIDFGKIIHAEYHALFCVYVMAEKFVDIATKKAVLAAAIEVTGSKSLEGRWEVPTFITINTVYSGTPQKSPARRLVTDMCSSLPLKSILERAAGLALHEDYIIDLANVSEKMRPRKTGCGGNLSVKKGVQAYLEDDG
jgi:hypothetical protein